MDGIRARVLTGRPRCIIIEVVNKENKSFIELSRGTYEELEGLLSDARESKKENRIADEDIARYGDVGGGNAWDLLVSEERSGNGYVGGIHQGESRSDTSRDNE